MQLRSGQSARHEAWFVRDYLRDDATVLVADIVRFVCCCIHPSNDILASDIVQRYHFIGWLFGHVRSNVVAASLKLALLLDWFSFDEARDGIMCIEPAALLVYHSLAKQPFLAGALVGFLCQMVNRFVDNAPELAEHIRKGIMNALLSLQRRRVLTRLSLIFGSHRLEPKLRAQVYSIWHEISDTLTGEAPGSNKPTETLMAKDSSNADAPAVPNGLSGATSLSSLPPPSTTTTTADASVRSPPLPTAAAALPMQQSQERHLAAQEPHASSGPPSALSPIDQPQPLVAEGSNTQNASESPSTASVEAELIEIASNVSDSQPMEQWMARLQPLLTQANTDALVAAGRSDPRLGLLLLLNCVCDDAAASMPLALYRQVAPKMLSMDADASDAALIARHLAAARVGMALPLWWRLCSRVLSGLRGICCGELDVIHALVMDTDATQLLYLQTRLQLGDASVFGRESPIAVALRTLEWETFEQICVWQLLEAEITFEASRDPSAVQLATPTVLRAALLPRAADAAHDECALRPAAHSEALSGLARILSTACAPRAAELRLAMALGDSGAGIVLSWCRLFPNQLAVLLRAGLQTGIDAHPVMQLALRHAGSAARKLLDSALQTTTNSAPREARTENGDCGHDADGSIASADADAPPPSPSVATKRQRIQ